MNLYQVDRGKGCKKIDYDEYDGFICAADSEDEARNMQPRNVIDPECGDSPDSAWPDPIEKLTATLIGKAAKTVEKGVLLASFNAG